MLAFSIHISMIYRFWLKANWQFEPCYGFNRESKCCIIKFYYYFHNYFLFFSLTFLKKLNKVFYQKLEMTLTPLRGGRLFYFLCCWFVFLSIWSYYSLIVLLLLTNQNLRNVSMNLMLWNEKWLLKHFLLMTKMTRLWERITLYMSKAKEPSLAYSTLVIP